MPDFGRQLQATTKMFLTLARRSSGDDAKGDDQTTSPSHDSDGYSQTAGAGKRKAGRKRAQSPERLSSPEAVVVRTEPEQTARNVPRWGGIHHLARG